MLAARPSLPLMRILKCCLVITHRKPIVSPGGSTAQTKAARMRWVIQLRIYISNSLSRAPRSCGNKGPIALWQGQIRGQGWVGVLGRGSGCCHAQMDGWVSWGGLWVLPCPGQGVPPCTHRGAQELAPVRAQVEDDSSPGSRQGGPPDEQDEQDDVGQCGCHPHHLGGGSCHPVAPPSTQTPCWAHLEWPRGWGEVTFSLPQSGEWRDPQQVMGPSCPGRAVLEPSSPSQRFSPLSTG